MNETNRVNDLPVTAAEAARAALATLEGGPAIVTVVMIEGPVPGRRLLVDETGRVRGTLGATALDGHAVGLARALLEGSGEAGTAGAQGATARGGSSALASAGVPALLDEAEVGGERVVLYLEAHRAPPSLVIVGAGHIAVPLARLGVQLGYRVTVLDDREDFATPVRFPDAAEVRRMDFEDPFRDVPIGPHSHVLLVTRAHKYDFDCLRRLLTLEPGPGYIGMLGSRRRVRAAFDALLEAGIPRRRLETVSAPVGLDIGAETPDEIAVSIAAELILLRRGGTGERIALRERVVERLLPERTESAGAATRGTSEATLQETTSAAPDGAAANPPTPGRGGNR